ncbi:MAG: hypothetical protein EBU23_09835 [Mycobacteriaceae bacterium]|nr:hypothetical protein [Mycobacteriaceae bacterium]
MSEQIDHLLDAIVQTMRAELARVDSRLVALERSAPRDGRDGLPGRDGKDGISGAAGRDGQDGVSFDDWSVDYDGERAFTVSAKAGDREKRFTFALPVPLYQGVFKADQGYERGDCVTHDGAIWIARSAPISKPGTVGSGWQLAVKRGQDGKR